MISIVLADDHAVVRSGLKMLLDAEPDIDVVAEASDVETTARFVTGHKPTVLVLDLSMGEESSLPAIPDLHERTPETAIVVLTMENDPAYATQALRTGALGYVLKQSAGEELVQAVRLAARGETYLSPRLGALLASQPISSADDLDGLTPRELEILKLIALGYTNAEIAEQLYLSTRTIETHRAHVQRKTGRSTRAELVRYALDHGLVA
jgi:two-component system, NarL family, response regulator NreC